MRERLNLGRVPGLKASVRGVRWRLGEPRMVALILWLLLFVVCWPLALLALVLYPLVWLLLLPLRLVGIVVGGVFALLAGLIFLPARLLGVRR